MTRLCERPGCSDRAEVAYGFDAVARSVWLDSLAVEPDARSGSLCRRHADAMGVPIGWTLDDRREVVPRLFRSEVTSARPSSATIASTARRRAEPAVTAEQLRFDTDSESEPIDGDVTDVPADAAPEAAEQQQPSTEPDDVAPWVPQFDHNDDLHGLLDATGPLLSRAFGGHSRPDR